MNAPPIPKGLAMPAAKAGCERDEIKIKAETNKTNLFISKVFYYM
jgi:hypothetical protein